MNPAPQGKKRTYVVRKLMQNGLVVTSDPMEEIAARGAITQARQDLDCLAAAMQNEHGTQLDGYNMPCVIHPNNPTRESYLHLLQEVTGWVMDLNATQLQTLTNHLGLPVLEDTEALKTQVVLHIQTQERFSFLLDLEQFLLELPPTET